MITLKLTFNTLEEATQFLQSKITPVPAAAQAPKAEVAGKPELAPKLATPPLAGPDKGSPSVEGVNDKGVTSAPAVAAPARKPGRPKKDPTATPVILAAALTETDVRAALMKVNDKFGTNGLAKVAEVIRSFGAQRVGELKPDQYAQVIAAAEAALA